MRSLLALGIVSTLLAGCGESHAGGDGSMSLDGSASADGSPRSDAGGPSLDGAARADGAIGSDAATGFDAASPVDGGSPVDGAIADAAGPDAAPIDGGSASDAGMRDGGATDPASALFHGFNAMVREWCECPEDIGFTTPEECREAITLTEDVRECLVDVYDDHSAELEEPFECVTDVVDDTTACAADATCDMMGACLNDFSDSAEECPTPPAELESEVEECFEE